MSTSTDRPHHAIPLDPDARLTTSPSAAMRHARTRPIKQHANGTQAAGLTVPADPARPRAERRHRTRQHVRQQQAASGTATVRHAVRSAQPCLTPPLARLTSTASGHRRVSQHALKGTFRRPRARLSPAACGTASRAHARYHARPEPLPASAAPIPTSAYGM